ncbi:MAG TPA: hypothetical protein VN841_25775 [Bryobacteraceae bacterium]|nr:hypothetical protein [Bryobacteraceae bacterium]
MEHNHGNEYQIKVIHEDGTEVLSEWIEHENVEQTMATLRDSKARGYWLRERNVTVATCPLCRDRETVIAEYPLTECLSPRSHPHDSSYLLETGFKDPYDASLVPLAAEPRLSPSRRSDVADG